MSGTQNSPQTTSHWLRRVEQATIVAALLAIASGVYVVGRLSSQVDGLDDRLKVVEAKGPSLPAVLSELRSELRTGWTADIETALKGFDPPSSASPVPIGSIIPYFGTDSSVPVDFLPCRGQPISQADYPDLFALLSAVTPDAAEAGTKIVRLPDLRGRFIRGVADGTKVGERQDSMVGPHSHQYSRVVGFYGHNYQKDSMGWADVPKSGEALRHSGEGGDGSNPYRAGVRTALEVTEPLPDSAFETRPINTSVLYIIRAR